MLAKLIKRKHTVKWMSGKLEIESIQHEEEGISRNHAACPQ